MTDHKLNNFIREAEKKVIFLMAVPFRGGVHGPPLRRALLSLIIKRGGGGVVRTAIKKIIFFFGFPIEYF